MGTVEHLKTLCCLGLPPESAMVAVVPVLHEIIPHGWSRLALFGARCGNNQHIRGKSCNGTVIPGALVAVHG